jgi:GT2 family glycosyltransferase
MLATASFVIPTRNRVEELRNLLRSLLAQTVPVEIHVMDDGEGEEPGEMIRREFPRVCYHRLGPGRGPAFQRNRGMELASTQIVFPVDDDTLFVSPRTVEQTLAEFDHPRVAAIGMPYINVRQDKVVRQRAPTADGVHVAQAFIGAAHAIRRDVFLKLGGYREHFFYMGEEGDLCVRMLQAGHVVRLGNADPILHYESTRRDLHRVDYYGKRNLIVFAWQNVPWPFLPFHLLATAAHGAWHGLTVARPRPSWAGLANGLWLCLTGRVQRAPVQRIVYRLNRRLVHGPLLLRDVEPILRQRAEEANLDLGQSLAVPAARF